MSPAASRDGGFDSAPTGRTLVARLDPRTRVVLAVAFSLTVVAVDHLTALVLALAAALVLAVLARLPWAATLRRMLALEGSCWWCWRCCPSP